VSCELSSRYRGESNVEDDDLHLVHLKRGQVVRVLLVPSQPQQGLLVLSLVDNSTVLQVAQIKHTDGTIGTNGGEHIGARRGKGNVEHLLVVCNQLSYRRLSLRQCVGSIVKSQIQRRGRGGVQGQHHKREKEQEGRATQGNRQFVISRPTTASYLPFDTKITQEGSFRAHVQ